MADSLALPNPLIRTNDTGLRLVSVGYTVIDGAYAWADFPLLFCPFCGVEAQARPEILARNDAPLDRDRHCCRFRERSAEVCNHPTLLPDGGGHVLAVGYSDVEGGRLAFFEVRIGYCPFCGKP